MKGIDVSNHNGSIDWNKLKNSDVNVVYIKASEGTTYQDPYLNEHYQGAKAIGLPTGFYHYLKGTSAPESQAQNFWSLIKDKENNLIPCLDIEENGFNVIDYALRFISKFKELSNLPILIYTGPYFANDNLDNRLASYPCWIAHYGVSSPMATKIWGTNYVGHQYTEKGSVPGINGNVDVNNFTEKIFINKINIQDNKTNNKAAVSDWLAEYLKSWNWSEWVGKLQRTVGVVTDKIVGPITLKACTLLKKKCTGELVKRLQEILKAYGFNCGNIDGIFGDKTYNAVVAFQKSRGLTMDGIVGQNTWKALLGL